MSGTYLVATEGFPALTDELLDALAALAAHTLKDRLERVRGKAPTTQGIEDENPVACVLQDGGS